VEDPSRLGRRVLQELRNPQNERWLSPISTWELLILHAKKRIRLSGNISSWIARATAPFQEAPLTHDIALSSRNLPLSHEDPADRFLAATAHVFDLTLVTADARLLGLGEISTLANR
jgi:PIN domain nuclease of toxin-antitoxin system